MAHLVHIMNTISRMTCFDKFVEFDWTFFFEDSRAEKNDKITKRNLSDTCYILWRKFGHMIRIGVKAIHTRIERERELGMDWVSENIPAQI